ncbi:MAG: hypothetical protein U9O97_02010 [Elusimicrobiota bacterium]|nr:hypothetical protein [Elusimicrobiota bacterium]
MVLILCPVFALPPEGPLAQISSRPGGLSARPGGLSARPGGLSAAEFRGEIEGAETIEVSFTKITKIKGSEKSFQVNGKIYYRKTPLFFRVELPAEALLIDAKSRKRLVKKYNEIYVDEWRGGNPLFMYFDLPGGVYESGSLLTGDNSAASSVVFTASRADDRIEAIYDRDEKMLKSIKVENPVMETFTEIKAWRENVEISSGVFEFPRGAKIIDMRK